MRSAILSTRVLAATLTTTLVLPAGAAATSGCTSPADGPSIGTFTLSQALALDFPNAVAETKSAYAVLVVSDAKGIVAIGGKIPDAGQHRYAFVAPAGQAGVPIADGGQDDAEDPEPHGEEAHDVPADPRAARHVRRDPERHTPSRRTRCSTRSRSRCGCRR